MLADHQELVPRDRSLSQRERDVLEMVARGLSNQEAASRLSVTVHTVRFHLGSIYRKLGVTNRTEAAVAYLRSSPTTTSAAGSDRTKS